MADCSPHDGGCLAVAKLAGEMGKLIAQVQAWSTAHQENSDRFMVEHDRRMGEAFDRLGVCLDATQAAAKMLAVGHVEITQQRKDIDEAHRRIRAHCDDQGNQHETEKKEVLDAISALEAKMDIKLTRLYRVAAGVVVFLMLTDHGRAMLEGLGKLCGFWGA